MQQQPNNWMSIAITAAIVLLVLFLRLRSASKERELKLERLWILPAIYAVFAGVLFASMPPHGLGWLYSALALVVGLALGWQRGKLMQITVHPEHGTLNQKASPAAVIFIVALVLVRMGAKTLMGVEVGSDGNSLHGNALIVTDILIAMALGFLVSQRVEMYLRAKKLLAAHSRP